jgi:hypothetical protein
MNLLPTRTAAKPQEKSAEVEEAPLAVPAYYEVWGGLESANRALWVALWFALTVALLAMILLRVALHRPPVVIRVDASGQAQAAADAGLQPAVSEAEVKNFLTLFERFYTQLNSYTYESDLNLAFAMMTPDFRSKALNNFKSQGLLEKLKTEGRKTTLTLTEIHVISDTPQVIECQVKGYREIGSYKQDAPPQEIVFEDDVILKKVARSEQAPNGVLVQDWNESLFKK